jgi:pimeloyl-ACP methyl ester carboxylesterase
MPFAESDDIKIYFEVTGNGPPLLLHHGYTASTQCWKEEGYVSRLQAHYSLILMDARGHGKSDKPHDPSEYDPIQRVEDVIAVLDALEIDKAHFWGYSMGGRVGFALARYAPERTASLIIGGMDPSERPVRHPDRPDGSDRADFLDFLLTVWNSSLDDLPRWQQKELLANDFRALAAADQDEPSMEEGLETTPIPFLLYAGDRDIYHDRARHCAAIIPKATFVSLPTLGHGATFSGPDLIIPHIRRFILEQSGRE